MRVLLIGNYGVGNLGDEALKDFFLQEFPNVDWVVINKDQRLPAGIRSLLSFRWIGTLKEYSKCDAVVFGGGSLFTDIESVFACVLWWIHSLPARVLGKPIHLAFQGVGPWKTRVGEWLTASVLQSSTTISVRDSASKTRAETLCKNKKIVQTSDPVICLIEKEKVHIRTENVLILIPRKNSSENFTNKAQKIVKSTQWDAIRVISMEPENTSEKGFVKSLSEALDSPLTVHAVRTLPELLSYIISAKTVLSERYHGALAALVLGKQVEIVVQRDGDKLSQLSSQDITADSVKEGVDYLRSHLFLQ